MNIRKSGDPSRSRRLIDLQTRNLPVGIRKRGRVVLHILLTGGGQLTATRRRVPHHSGPAAAQRGVEHDVHILKMGVEVALL